MGPPPVPPPPEPVPAAVADRLAGDRAAGDAATGGASRPGADSSDTAADTPDTAADTPQHGDNPPENPAESDNRAADSEGTAPGELAAAGAAGSSESDHGATSGAGAGAGDPGAAGDPADEALEDGPAAGDPVDEGPRLIPEEEYGREAATNAARDPITAQFRSRNPDVTPPEKRNWDVIRRHYVEGFRDREHAGAVIWPSLTDTAAHFKVPLATLRERSAGEGWVQQRADYQALVEDRRRRTKAQQLATQSTQLENRALESAQLGLQLIFARLGEIAQEVQANRANSVGEGRARSGIKADEQQKLAAAADLWHKIGLRAIGDPETHRVELTGPGGRPIEIAQELRRDDPDRLTGVLAVLQRAGLGDIFQSVPGEVVEDGGDDGAAPAIRARR